MGPGGAAGAPATGATGEGGRELPRAAAPGAAAARGAAAPGAAASREAAAPSAAAARREAGRIARHAFSEAEADSMKPKAFIDHLDHDGIVAAIREAESRSRGEIRVHVANRKVEDAQRA